MKVLTLVCDCGQRATVMGEDTVSIMSTIDAHGWIDCPDDDDNPLPKGHQPALCPACLEHSDLN